MLNNFQYCNSQEVEGTGVRFSELLFPLGLFRKIFTVYQWVHEPPPIDGHNLAQYVIQYVAVIICCNPLPHIAEDQPELHRLAMTLEYKGIRLSRRLACNTSLQSQKGYIVKYTVSAWGLDKGYTVKYGLSPREFLHPKGTPEGSGHILLYIPKLGPRTDI